MASGDANPPRKTLLLRNAHRVYTCDDEDRVLPDSFILIEDQRIAEIGSEPCPHISADRTMDLEGCLVLPGFISVHHHFYQSLSRAVPMTQRAGMLDWLAGMYPLWAELDPETMYWASLVAAAELLLTGATTCADHSYLLPGEDSAVVASEVQAVREAGLRLHLVRGCLPALEGDLVNRLAPLMGDRMAHLLDTDEALLFERMERDLHDFHDTSLFSMLRLALGPSGITFDNPGLMRRIADLADANGAGLHAHYHPREMEREISRKLHNCSPPQFLGNVGWLQPSTWFAHCTRVDSEDLRAFGSTGCGIAHCPRTVIRLGYNVTPIGLMRRHGVNVGLGVDGPASNDSGGMMDTVRLGLLLHRAGAGSDADQRADWMTPYDALLMATRSGARILGRDDIGQLAPGKAADIVAYDMCRVAYAGGMADPLGGLLMGGWDAGTTLTVVGGKVLVQDGQLQHLDESKIVEQANAVAARALETAAKRTGLPFQSYPHRERAIDR
jgi:cytosine/adenosine deaminase-related metal-dependent hydrolase